MIEANAKLRIERIPLSCLLVVESESAFPEKFAIYLGLLQNNPNQDVEPIVVEPHARYDDIYIIRNGKHRYAASILSGRKDILGIIVEEAHAA